MDVDLNGKSVAAMPYVDPISIDYPKSSSCDYEALPELSSMYEIADYVTPDEPYQYEEATTSTFTDSMAGETLPDDGQIYEDPGHNKEEIYSWFEERKFRKLERSDIK